MVLFMICYTILFYKKMDMVFFPYNSMYTIDFTKSNKAVTYTMKINGNIVKITNQPYWKKDFLETSLAGYCNYILHDRTVFLDNYINQKFRNEQARNILLNRLTPGKTAAINWPRWYARFAGYTIPENAAIELWQYDLSYEKGNAVLTDSLSIYKTSLP